MRVAVIGAGAAGLVALRHLTAKPSLYRPVAFEQTGVIGGTWVYTENTGVDEHGLPIHASITNLPKEVMAFPDFPFPKDLPSFLPHEQVRKYLEDYADHFKLYQYIQFNSSVECIYNDGTEWQVTIQDVTKPAQSTRTFDAILVCNGHYSVPLVPKIPGLSTYKGKIIHSHDYRHPELFQDKTVLCLGAGASGQDIILDLSPYAKQVYLSHNKPQLKSVLPKNIQQVGGVKELTCNGVILNDGTEINIDAFIFSTGYHFTFSFLSSECKVSTKDEHVTPLYKHIIHIDYPTLAFIGICKTICPFPQFDCQIRFVLASLEGTMKLPSKESMKEDAKMDFEWRLSQGFPVRHAHHLGPLQWDYNDQLAELAGFKPIPKIVRKLYDYVHSVRVKDLGAYKNMNFEVLSDEEFKVIDS